MGKKIVAGLVLGGLVVAMAPPAGADISGQQVRQAIGKGVQFLKSQQRKGNGNWPEHEGQPGGLTALCVLALINAGQDPQDADMQRALNYLRKLGKPSKTYTAALITMALCAAEPERDRLLISRNAKWLERAQITEGERSGTWGYSGAAGRGDNSNTQFALLALHEAERVGVQISETTWRRSLDYWSRSQEPDGSWSYYRQIPRLPSTGSMTCAGIASLIITMGQLQQGDASVVNGQVRCCGQQTEDDRIERGLQWMGQHFTVKSNPGSRAWLLYYLYGVERVGRLTGRRFIGRADWYREGAAHLVNIQDPLSGQWKGTGVTENNPVLATALALLFLSKGRRPVLMGQLKHSDRGIGTDANWNLHRGAVANLTRRIERKWRRDLTWQTIDISVAGVDDLLQTPVLFISGRQALNLTPEQQQSLRDYVNQGGFIFAEACNGNGCDGEAFDRTFRQLMRELFPESPLRKLPPDHAVWFAEEKILPDHMPQGMWLEGIDACCRTSVVYCPQSLSCYWELSRGQRETSYPLAVKNQIEAVLRIGQNVLAYATNRELNDKLDRPQVTVSDDPTQRLSRGTLYIPKLSHSGGSDDAPNALRNLLTVARHELQIRVNTDRQLLAATDPRLFEHAILFTHGRRSFRFSAVERKALQMYLERGGFLFADAICGSPQFADAFRRELESIFPDQQLVRIPPQHPIFSTQFRGSDLSRVTLRDPQARASGDAPLRAKLTQTTPLLEGLEVDGRLAVVLSPYDLSCALENQPSLECKGYIKQDAARIGINIILYALQQ